MGKQPVVFAVFNRNKRLFYQIFIFGGTTSQPLLSGFQKPGVGYTVIATCPACLTKVGEWFFFCRSPSLTPEYGKILNPVSGVILYVNRTKQQKEVD